MRGGQCSRGDAAAAEPVGGDCGHPWWSRWLIGATTTVRQRRLRLQVPFEYAKVSETLLCNKHTHVSSSPRSCRTLLMASNSHGVSGVDAHVAKAT